MGDSVSASTASLSPQRNKLLLALRGRGGGGRTRRSPPSRDLKKSRMMSSGRRSKLRQQQQLQKQDSNILRGAEIIRQQLRKQLEEEDAFRKNAAEVRDNLLGNGNGNVSGNSGDQSNLSGQSGQTEPSLEEDDDDCDGFSDHWKIIATHYDISPNSNHSDNIIGHKNSDDSSTIFSQLPSSLNYWEDVECSSIDYSASPDKFSLAPSAPNPSPPLPPPSSPPSPSSPGKKLQPQQQRGLKTSNSKKSSSSKTAAGEVVVLRAVKKEEGYCYSFVGDDYDSDLDQDDHFNSSNINSYLPGHLRKHNNKKASKSWSPSAVSSTTSSPASSPALHSRKVMEPRRLESLLYSPPSTKAISHQPSIHEDKASRFSSKAVAASQTSSLHNDTKNNSSKKLKLQQQQQQQPSSRSSQPQQQQQQQLQPTTKSTPTTTTSKWSKLQQQLHLSKQRQSQQQQPLSSANVISRTYSEKTNRDLTAGLVGYHTATSPAPSSLSDSVVSPLSIDYDMLLHDPAFCHARKAGLVWQSLVGQHVRFPSRWWNGARGPPLGIMMEDHGGDPAFVAPWEYLVAGNCRVAHCPPLNRLVRTRAAPGRLVLHCIVLHQGRAVADLVVGVVHPNARGVRTTPEANPDCNTMRTLWMAVRKRTQSCDFLDSFAKSKSPFIVADAASEDATNDNGSRSTPRKRRVTNENVRAVYGEEPPVETLFVPQWELEQRMALQAPAMALLQEFVFD